MNLKAIRIDRNLKAQEVAEYLCCQPSVYSRYESGQREPSIDVLLKLSSLYSVSVDYLIGNEAILESVSKSEAKVIQAFRSADERAQLDALALLELHKK